MANPETRLTKSIVESFRNDFPDAFIFKVLGGAFSVRGVPDLVGCIEGRFIAFEVKIEGNGPSRVQLYMIDLIRKAGGLAGVVYNYEDVLDVLRPINSTARRGR